MYILCLFIDIVLAAILIHIHKRIIEVVTLVHTNMNKKEEEKATQTKDCEYYSDISSDCTECTGDWLSQLPTTREKRTIFDTVLRLPESQEASNIFEKSSSPMPIVDQQVLLDSLRDASREGIFSRQSRSVQVDSNYNRQQQQQQQQQRKNSRGPLFKDGV